MSAEPSSRMGHEHCVTCTYELINNQSVDKYWDIGIRIRGQRHHEFQSHLLIIPCERQVQRCCSGQEWPLHFGDEDVIDTVDFPPVFRVVGHRTRGSHSV